MFKDRADAAEKLGKKLEWLRAEQPVILAIPRGGVVTGDVLANMLGVKLDIIVSRKIGAPNNPELAIGAVAHDGTFYPNSDIINMLGISKEYIDRQINLQLKEIDRRLMLFRGSKDYDLKDKTVVLVDDGIATGATMFIAIKFVKNQDPRRIIVAIPVAPKDTIEKMSSLAEVIFLYCPPFFNAVGEFYDVFDQIEDSRVMEIMRRYGYTSRST